MPWHLVASTEGNRDKTSVRKDSKYPDEIRIMNFPNMKHKWQLLLSV
jgi:hypothetical protein